MLRPRRTMRPELDSLESRVALATSGVTGPLHIHGLFLETLNLSVAMVGDQAANLVGSSSGRGQVAPLGSVHTKSQHVSLQVKDMNGVPQLPIGFPTNNNQPVVLIGRHGTISLKLGNVTTMTGQEPTATGTFTITGGTGAYRGATGTGTQTTTLAKPPALHLKENGITAAISLKIVLSS